MYLSDNAKLHIKQILMLWDELGHEPSFDDFNSDPRTPTANSLAFYFGSYSKGVEIARRYYSSEERRKELEKPPEEPVPVPNRKKPKRGKKSSPLANGFQSKNRPKPAEKASLVSEPPKETPQTILEPPKEVPQVAPEPPKPAPQAIPEPPQEKLSEPPQPETPQKSPEPLESPSKLEDAKIPAPDAKTPQTQKEPPSLATTEKEVKPMANNSQGFVNLYRKPVALVTEKQLQHISEGILIDEPAHNNDDGVAVAMTVEITVGSIGGLNNNIPPVAITTTFSEPKLIKDNRPHNFPDPRDGVLLFVSKEVAEAARDIGRDTDDLVFPKHFYETDTTIYCSRVEKLQS